MRIVSYLFILFFISIQTLYSQAEIRLFNIDNSQYPVVSSEIIAFNSNGNLITKLDWNQINVTDNGSPVPINNIEIPEQNIYNNISFLLSFDLASNTKNNGSNSFVMAKDLAQKISDLFDYEKSDFCFSSFDDASYLNQEFTHNKSKIDEVIENLESSRGSLFNEGLLSLPAGAIELHKVSKNNRVITLLTDGTGDVNADSVISQAKQNNIKFIIVSFGNELSEDMKRIAKETNGFFFESIHDLNDNELLARTILEFAHNYQAIKLSWQGLVDCDPEHQIEVSLKNEAVSDTTEYEIPDDIQEYFDLKEDNLGFGAMLPPGTRDLNIEFTAVNDDIFVESLELTETSHFQILFGDIKNQIIEEGNTHTVTIRFTPTDSAIVFGRFIINSTACAGEEVIMTAGFPNTPPHETTVRITNPECGDVLVIGESTDVIWEGLLPRDVVQLDYSLDNGENWEVLVSDINGLKYHWEYPSVETDQLQIKITQLWPNNAGRTMNLIHEKGVNSALFNSDNSRVVTACQDSVIRIWNANQDELLQEFKGHKAGVTWAMFSPDEKLIVSASNDSTIKMWNIETSSLEFTKKEHNNLVRSAVFNPDPNKKEFISASFDGKVILWDYDGNKIREIESSPSPVWFANYSPDGKYIATAGINKAVNIYNSSDGSKVKSFQTPAGFNSHVTFSRDGKRVAVANQLDSARVWDFNSGTQLCSMVHLDSLDNPTPINFSDFDVTGDTVITCGVDQKIRMWYVPTGELVNTFIEHTNTVNTAIFNFDAYRLLTASWDNTAKIWNRQDKDLQVDSLDCPIRIARADLEADDVFFGQVVYGEAVDTMLVEFIHNKQDFPYEIKDIKVEGAAKDDYTIWRGKAPYTIEADEFKDLEIRFKPRNLGFRPAVLEIHVPDSVIKYELNGEGISPGLQVINKYVDFNKVQISDFKDTTFTILVKNRSIEAIDLTDISVLGPDDEHFDIISGSDVKTLQPEEGVEMTLRFTPEFLGRLNGSVRFNHTGLASPSFVYLFGEGTDIIVDSLTISIPDVEAETSQTVDLPFMIKHDLENIPESLSGFVATLSFNSTIVAPVENQDMIISDTIINENRILKLQLGLDDDNDGILEVLKLNTALGNDSISRLNIQDIYPLGKAKIKIIEESSTLRLTDICNDGKNPRLFDQSTRLSLEQNFPNPAVEETMINYELREKGRTSLKITDLNGNTVRVEFDRYMETGQYKYTLNTKELNNGVYFYILETPNQRIVKQMTVSK